MLMPPIVINKKIPWRLSLLFEMSASSIIHLVTLKYCMPILSIQWGLSPTLAVRSLSSWTPLSELTWHFWENGWFSPPIYHLITKGRTSGTGDWNDGGYKSSIEIVLLLHCRHFKRQSRNWESSLRAQFWLSGFFVLLSVTSQVDTPQPIPKPPYNKPSRTVWMDWGEKNLAINGSTFQLVVKKLCTGEIHVVIVIRVFNLKEDTWSTPLSFCLCSFPQILAS